MTRLRRAARVRGVRAVLVCAALVCALPMSALLPPSSSASAREDPELEVALESLTPTSGVPGAQLRVTGRVVNAGTEPVVDPMVRLRFSSTALGTREDIDSIVSGESGSRLGYVLTGTTAELAGPLQPGADVAFDLQYPLDLLGLPRQMAVYAVGIETGTGVNGSFVSSRLQRTFLPWVPEPDEVRPTRLAWLWPLVDAPRRDAGGAFSDDGLSASMGGGRLRNLLEIGAAAPPGAVSWVVDPMLLEDAEVMSGGYPVPASDEAGGGPGSTESDGAAAQAWLERFRTISADVPVMALPYADQDVVAVNRAGLAADVRLARAAGTSRAQRILGRSVVSDVIWPAQGALDRETGRLLRDSGVTTAVLSEDATPPEDLTSITPTGRALVRLGGGARLAGVLYDERLSTLVATPAASGTTLSGALLEQRFLAETALITTEVPDQRTIVIAPPKRWDPDPVTLAAMVRLPNAVPWLTPVGLADVRATDVSDIGRAPLTYTAAARAQELPAMHLLTVARARRDLSAFAKVLTEPAAVVPAFRSALLRLESAGWRDHPVDRNAATEAVTGALAAQRAKVSLLGSRITLGARSGVFPVTVVNDLDQAVRVRVDLTSDNPRLTVHDSEPVVVEAEQKQQLQLPVEAVANGVIEVRGRLLAPDGTVYGSPVEIRVRVAQYGTLGVWVTGGAALVLFGAVAVRLLRRTRRTGRTATRTDAA